MDGPVPPAAPHLPPSPSSHPTPSHPPTPTPIHPPTQTALPCPPPSGVGVPAGGAGALLPGLQRGRQPAAHARGPLVPLLGAAQQQGEGGTDHLPAALRPPQRRRRRCAAWGGGAVVGAEGDAQWHLTWDRLRLPPRGLLTWQRWQQQPRWAGGKQLPRPGRTVAARRGKPRRSSRRGRLHPVLPAPHHTHPAPLPSTLHPPTAPLCSPFPPRAGHHQEAGPPEKQVQRTDQRVAPRLWRAPRR